MPWDGDRLFIHTKNPHSPLGLLEPGTYRLYEVVTAAEGRHIFQLVVDGKSGPEFTVVAQYVSPHPNQGVLQSFTTANFTVSALQARNWLELRAAQMFPELEL